MKNHFITSLLFCFCMLHVFAQEAGEDRIILKTNETYTGEIVLQNEKVVVIMLPDGTLFQFPASEVRTIIRAGQEDNPPETGAGTVLITLKTGQRYSGEIVLQNEQIIMIKTSDGARFQFPAGEIESVRPGLPSDNAEVQDVQYADDGQFVMSADVSFGLSHSGRAYGWAPSLQGALILGAKDVFIRGMFAGIGAGCHAVFPSGYKHMDVLTFLPVFVRLQSVIGPKRAAPYVELDGGYSFSLDEESGGGLLLRVSAGIALRLTYRSNLYIGAYGGIQNFSGSLSTSYQSGTYEYYGKTSMQQIGLKAALRF